MNTSNSSKLGVRREKNHRRRRPKKKRKRTQASYRTTNRLPERQKQTNSRERLLSSTQRPWILFLVTSMRRLIIRLHLQLQRRTVMFKQQLPKVSSLREVILEYNFGSKSDMSTELVPSRIALDQGMLQSLWRSINFFYSHFCVTRHINSPTLLSVCNALIPILAASCCCFALTSRSSSSSKEAPCLDTQKRNKQKNNTNHTVKNNALLSLLFLESISNRLDQLFQFSYRTRILNSFTILKSTVRPIL